MSSGATVFDAIAEDIGVVRYSKESAPSFRSRVVYSACRFWVLAFCMDDGNGSKDGLSMQGINRRLKIWLTRMGQLQPELYEWFKVFNDGLPNVYRRMMDIGDLKPNGFGDTYIATPPLLLHATRGCSLITGFFDATSDRPVLNFDRSKMITTGLATIVSHNNNQVNIPVNRWENALGYLPWENSNAYENVVYINGRTNKWNIKNTDAWTDRPEWVDGISLASINDANGVPLYFIANKSKHNVRLSPITWIQAQELFFYLRNGLGNQAWTSFEQLDSEHVKIKLPIGFVPSSVNRFLDAMTWPVGNVSDRFLRVARAEAVGPISELLSACSVGVREK